MAQSFPCVPAVLSFCGQITSTCHSSSSASPLPFFHLSFHPFIPGCPYSYRVIELVWLTIAFQCGQRCLTYTLSHERTHTQTLCSPSIYLTQCLYSLAKNWPLAGQMDGWPMVVLLSSLSHTHTHRHTQWRYAHRGGRTQICVQNTEFYLYLTTSISPLSLSPSVSYSVFG